MRRKTLIAAGIVAMLTGSASAQQAPVQAYGEKDQDKTWAERQAEKEAERAYRRSLGNVPNKDPVDPWGNARSAEAPKPPAKAEAKAVAKPKAKAGAPN
jgi:hypothetical protein